MAARVRFDWEEALAQDLDLQRIDASVKLTFSKLPGLPAPRTDVNRGSRYEAVPSSAKAEQPSTVSTSDSGRLTPQFINIRDYRSESSSSEADTREVNPMDELSDFEPDSWHPQKARGAQDSSLDVEMRNETMETACEVCKQSDREDEIILCDDCNAEYHLFCLQPPLETVPDASWYCPKCCSKHPAAPMVSVKPEPTRADREGTTPVPAPVRSIHSLQGTGNVSTFQNDSTDRVQPTHSTQGVSALKIDPTAISIAQALENDPRKSNLLLIHACNCDDIKCTDPELHVFCPHMKRFLRSVCWASHSDKWRSYRLARITAKLLAYHAMSCSLPQCNVPLCVKVREEEIV